MRVRVLAGVALPTAPAPGGNPAYAAPRDILALAGR